MATTWYLIESGAKSTLDGAVLAADATITVNDASTFPATGNFFVTVWDGQAYFDPNDDFGAGTGEGMEIMLVTGVAGNDFTVTRNQGGVGDVGHADTNEVRLLIIAEIIEQVTGAFTTHDHSAAGDGAAISHGDLADLSTGADHSWLDQDLKTTGTPQFARLGVGRAPAEDLPFVMYDNAVDYVATIPGAGPYYGISAFPTKTGGATTNVDDFGAAGFYMDMDQAGGTIGDLYGSMNRATLTDGNVGDAGVAANIYGARALADLDGGKVWGYATGLYAQIDMEAGSEIALDGRVIWLRGDFDGTVTGNAIMLYLEELTGVDYGIYQDGTADNVLGGALLMLDKIIFTQTDGDEYIDSLNDGYVDYGATTAHRFNNDVRLIEDTADTASPKLSFYGGNTRTGTIQQLEDAASFSAFVMATNGSIELQTDTVARLTIDAGGDVIISGELEMDGALNHDGATAGFYGTTPIAQALLATGAGATVDNVITALQNLGLVKQT